ncbi:CDP-diacylglycerol--serine O-phosphatidyltransferase [uncultured Pelagimonas sp.]|uniref:CDP-diacylglycerol--serine O-phosphatidyltransferase n=1 Tax=uncultured Pelagimonas sp. TaxID=1618102 RepID=UPI00261E5755|nr:CDP-diacylglycerol--serine O-phosphatidyltransferase [uncultured Pelagimonas sp.]
MTNPNEKQEREFSLIQLLPNALTIAAICAGLTAIRMAAQDNYVLAVNLILLAGVLDGLDGRLARALGSDSEMGAELDSLADFLNFGVAPPLILYFWALQDVRGIGWFAALVFAMCCVIRLARFNVGNKTSENEGSSAFFEGVPSPAGAYLVMVPLYWSFAFPESNGLPGLVLCLYIIIIGLLMVSQVPTWSFKATKISRSNLKFFFFAISIVFAALLTYAWLTLIVLCLAYVATVVWAWVSAKRS